MECLNSDTHYMYVMPTLRKATVFVVYIQKSRDSERERGRGRGRGRERGEGKREGEGEGERGRGRGRGGRGRECVCVHVSCDVQNFKLCMWGTMQFLTQV